MRGFWWHLVAEALFTNKVGVVQKRCFFPIYYGKANYMNLSPIITHCTTRQGGREECDKTEARSFAETRSHLPD